jgi:hypothetical protein
MAVSGQVVTVYMRIIRIIILSKRFSWYQNTKRQEAGAGSQGHRDWANRREAGNILDPQKGNSLGRSGTPVTAGLSSNLFGILKTRRDSY